MVEGAQLNESFQWFDLCFIAIRECTVNVGAPWEDMVVERKMPALKFYHDLSCGELQNYFKYYTF